VIPHSYYHLARIIHEERIAASRRPRPDSWFLDAGPSPRQASRVQQVRRWLAGALVTIAVRLEPEWLHLANKELSPGGATQ
jgi:hypothetical protein